MTATSQPLLPTENNLTLAADFAEQHKKRQRFIICCVQTQPVGFGKPAYLHACFAGP